MKDNERRARERIDIDTTDSRQPNGITLDPSSSESLRVIREVVSQYVGQLLHGCGRTHCKESLCATGRRNTSQKPVRNYTARSARAVAITLASGPRPRSRLCPNYSSRAQEDVEQKPEGPRDPSSFIQHWSDTESVRALCDVRAGDQLRVSNRHSRFDSGLYEQLRHHNSSLDSLSRAFVRCPNDSVDKTNNDIQKLADGLWDCLQWLADTFPRGVRVPAQYTFINQFIGDGCAYIPSLKSTPSDEKYNNWLELLDRLDHEPSARLVYQVMDVLAQSGFGQQLYVAFADRIKTAERIDRMNIILWLRKAFISHWNGELILKKTSIPFATLNLLELTDKPMEPFPPMPFVYRRVDAAEMAQTYMDFPDLRSTHLLSFNCIFDAGQKGFYFRTINHLRMRAADSEAQKAYSIRTSRAYQRVLRRDSDQLGDRVRHLEEHYLLLDVSRGNVLKDAFDQLWHRRKTELLRPLRVRLGEAEEFEIGHDLGGVQIEFFNLVCKELFAEKTQMFTTDLKTGLSYFRPGSLQPLYMFELCGLLFGLALYNGITLPVNFPKAFYLQILGQECTDTDSISDGWPTIAKSLQAILQHDIDDLEATYPLEANGLRLSVLPETPPVGPEEDAALLLQVVDATRIDHHDSHSPPKPPTTTAVNLQEITHAWPGWQIHPTTTSQPPPLLTPASKPAYIKTYLTHLTHTSIAPQLHAFRKRLLPFLPPPSLLPPSHLQSLLEGTPHLSLPALRAASTYTAPFHKRHPYILLFWSVLGSWSEARQKALVRFVTAAERIPAGGAGELGFRIQKGDGGGNMLLPTSSTCFGVLNLPVYEGGRAVLEERLRTAVEWGGVGFGTG